MKRRRIPSMPITVTIKTDVNWDDVVDALTLKYVGRRVCNRRLPAQRHTAMKVVEQFIATNGSRKVRWDWKHYRREHRKATERARKLFPELEPKNG